MRALSADLKFGGCRVLILQLTRRMKPRDCDGHPGGIGMDATQVKASELPSLLERHLPQPYRFYRDFVPQWALDTLGKARVRRLVEKVGTDVVLLQEKRSEERRVGKECRVRWA